MAFEHTIISRDILTFVHAARFFSVQQSMEVILVLNSNDFLTLLPFEQKRY